MNDYPTLNIDLLDRVMEWVEQSHEKQEMVKAEKGWNHYPSVEDMIVEDMFVADMIAAIGDDIWYQNDWRMVTDCGTAFCVAGKACDLSGVQWAGTNERLISETEFGVWDVQEKAQHLLGLTVSEADRLFKGSNTVEDLRVIVAEIKSGATR
jgi:hypothetical protein